MSEELVPEQTAPVEQTDAEIEAQVHTDEKGEKRVSLKALQEERALRQQLAAKLKDLEPVAQRTREVEERLEQARPVIEAVLNNPALAAQVKRATRPSSEETLQPANDPEATEYAETFGWYTVDGQPDVARAQRAIRIMDGRSRRHAEDVVRPLAGYTMNSRADANLRQLMDMRDDNGMPFATAESIRECAEALGVDGRQLLANPKVAELILDNAMGRDKRLGRAPKALDEPLYMESGAGRRSALGGLTPEEKAFCEREEIPEKRYIELSKRSNGRGIVLGSKS